MASEMMEALMALCQEKHIDQLYLLDCLEQSLAKSYADILHLDWAPRLLSIALQAGFMSTVLSLVTNHLMRKQANLLNMMRLM